MKILGIDTTTRFLCLGIYNDTKIYEYNLDVGRRLSSLITPTIKRVLDALGWQIKDIDYFACGLGPGSFTGMRVGIATVKGLAFSLNKPVAGISTLDILARNAGITATFVIPIVDARRNLIYCSIYRNKFGQLTRIKPYMLLTIDEFLKKIKIKGNAVILGDAVNLYKQKILMHMKNITVLDKDYWYPRGRNIIDLAIERINSKKVDSASEIKPVYLYPKECQIKSLVNRNS
ncbi:MAG: tRNA (adenosine(37)-N6)-threonylcarbamoyltransferase complex dimerization subunit type 1 TsaB [Candidatus Omnitrophica bacterium CG23_combo_of_CG06-09_8_20_14_all_40_11]|nr:MAG: tRNA (adenosine(37)-N6)-threonylcarbamoyltransferase complex dimerization subunit type 1 TsaB [Candidatus Omnitrophica bacterium CG23_combo_of_CG06-09_8_20_14_all_40_11]